MEERREMTSKVGNVVVAAAAGSGCFRRHYVRARSMGKDDGSEDARDDHVISRSQATRECVEVNAGGEHEDVCEVDCRRGTSVSHSLWWVLLHLAGSSPPFGLAGCCAAVIVGKRAWLGFVHHRQPTSDPAIHLFLSSPQPAIMHDPSATVELLFLSESLKSPKPKHIKPRDVVGRRQEVYTCHKHGSEGALDNQSSCLANRL